ncbi:hypothetical protein CASFOL_005377 [Castilleja foliolosa]|uniref:Uncharacterized protein n=1 Tax=Castilleja foliolosa TaxID=1961234 RepID=A0ABD3E4C1_9LAMI
MAESEMCIESSTTTAEKRRISPEIPPNTKGVKGSVSEVLDPSQITRQLNELASKLEDDSGDGAKLVALSSLLNEIETIGGDVQSTDPQDPEDVAEELGINIFHSIIYKLYEHPFSKNVACKIASGSTVAFILETLLKSVFQPRASFDEDCKTHYEIVKRAWEDIELTSLLLEEESSWYIIDGYYDESNEQLLEKFTPLIKGHLPMKEILPKTEEQSDIVRRALTILIGYLSAKDSVLPFDDLMGRGGFIGIRTFRYSDTPDDMKVEPLSSSGAFIEPSSCTLEALMPDSSLVTQLLHDSSFKDVAQQIESYPSSAKFAKIVLSYFASNFDKGCIPTYLRRGIFNFWRSGCLVPLSCALEKSSKSSNPSLFNIFKQLSDGAEMLRLKERLSRIREDNFWKTIDIHKCSFSLKMRLALCILIGYWSTQDMTKAVMLLLSCNKKKPLNDLKDVEIVSYWADQSHDLKGLKKVLSKEYQENSDEVEHRIAEIESRQKLITLEAVGHGYDVKKPAVVTAVLKDGSCIHIILRWYFNTSGVLKRIVC